MQIRNSHHLLLPQSLKDNVGHDTFGLARSAAVFLLLVRPGVFNQWPPDQIPPQPQPDHGGACLLNI
ncbi:hypothetical protein, partial [Agrobacterium vitis]|uniref:hypothetical protein n=1 Tax=Agrobacterium vitis TaxID=373 RepID=UPI0020344D0C